MKLSISAVVLAVFASAIAAPQYGRNEKLTQTYAEKPIATTTLAADIPAEFDCAGKENRGYVIGCNQDYFLCWDEVMTKASCPEGMMYNQDNGQCDFNTNIFECTGVRTTVGPLADEYSTLAPIDFDCSKLSDGDYAYSHECQLTYVSCVGGQGIERTCPDELSFDPENRLCDRLETIEACGGSPTTAAPIADAVKVDYECPSPSGTFALTSQLCSAVYYACEDNVATIAICEEPMIWNDANKECALAHEIPDCSFDCAGKADAAYSTGCSNNYWWCWQERATKLACPEGMMFDGERALCDVEENIFECTGVRTTTPLADAVPTMAPVDFDCAGLEDGNHAYKNGELCQEKFVSCVGGFAWEMTCPDSLMFDPEELMCERIEAIVACGGTAEPLSTTAISYDQYTKATTVADVPTTKSYNSYTKKTTVADVPTTKAYGYKKTTTLADIPTTKAAYGYNKKATTVADVPTTKAYNSYTKKTTVADVPTTKSYGYKKTTTVVADIPTTQSYGSYEKKIVADVPTTRKAYAQRTTTVAADLPTEEASYGSYETTTVLADIPTTKAAYGYSKKIVADVPTTRRSYNQKLTTTTLAADVPSDDYNNYETTTILADIPTTRRAYAQRTTTLADLPTTRRAYAQRKATTVADVPADDYSSYETTTVLADIPTTRRAYAQRKIVADVPTTTLGYNSDSYGEKVLLDMPTTRRSHVRKMTTTIAADVPSDDYETTTLAADIPIEEASYGSYETTTLADIPTEEASYGAFETTTLADEPSDLGYNSDAYGESMLLDEPTTPRRRQHKMKTTTIAADVPSDYNSYETTTLAEPTTRRSYTQRTTTLADLPTTKSYGYKKTTTLADIPTTKSYGYKQTTTFADIPTTRRSYAQRTTTLADLPTEEASYGSYETTTLADIPTTRRSYNQRKTTTLADIPEEASYGSFETTTFADLPTTRQSYSSEIVADAPRKPIKQGY